MKHWKTRILSKGSLGTLNYPKASKKNCQWYLTKLVKQSKTSTPRLYAKNPMTLHFQTYLKMLLKKILLGFNTSKAAGMDQIPAKCLTGSAGVLALPLRNIINLLIKLSIFPEECKIVKLKPVFKKGVRTDPTNCRPISLWPLIPGIIEKSIHFQIEVYLNQKI